MPKAEKNVSSPKPKKEKPAKDPNAPKKPLSAYMFFCKANRDSIKAANPDSKFGELGKLQGDAWKACDESEKKKYEEQAAEDKERYKREMEDYVPPSPKAKPAPKKKAPKKKAASSEDEQVEDDDDE